MLSRSLHLLGGNLLVVSHGPTLHVFKLLKVLLPLGNIIVQSDLLCNGFAIRLYNTLCQNVQLLNELILRSLEVLIRFSFYLCLRRFLTPCARISKTSNESSQLMQASVMLVPYLRLAGSSFPGVNFWAPSFK